MAVSFTVCTQRLSASGQTDAVSKTASVSPFTADAALDYARRLAHPRFTGSPAEAAAAEALARQLSAWGYSVERQPFEFSTAVNHLVTLTLTVGLAGVIGVLALLGPQPTAAAVAATLVLAAPLLLRRLQPRAERGALQSDSPWAHFGNRHRAANLIARFPPASSSAALPHLVLMAHYDSKSQRLPIGLRVALVLVTLFGSAALCASAWLALLWPAWSSAAAVAGVITLVGGAPLVWMDWADDSPGAIDNASGVGVVMHLAEILARWPAALARLRWTIVLTSAEELGLMGAAAFAAHYAAQMQAERAVVLNFDGVGVEGRLHISGSAPSLRSALRRAARTCGVPVRDFSMPGVLFDHMPLGRAGLDAVTLLAIGPATWSVHTPRDTAAKLHPRGFAEAGAVALSLIEHLAQAALQPNSPSPTQS